jgi:hypothetical protein
VPVTDTGRNLGTRDVDGTECYHLVFKGDAVDWQIWIETGDRPLPHKIVITYRDAPGVPTYRAKIGDWNLDPDLAKDRFVFAPPADADKVDILPIADEG